MDKKVHMDHVYIKEVGLFIILVDSYSCSPKVVNTLQRNVSSVKQVLSVVFSRNRKRKKFSVGKCTRVLLKKTCVHD